MKLSFNASAHNPLQELSAIPAGQYPVVIEALEQRDNSGDTGKHLAMTLTVTDGKYKGRKVFTNLNVWNDSAKAAEFAMSALTSICLAVGLESFEDTDELLNRGFIADVGVQNDATYGKKNTVRGYKAAGTPVTQPAVSDNIADMA